MQKESLFPNRFLSRCILLLGLLFTSAPGLLPAVEIGGTIKGSFAVDRLGSATYSIPIVVPPGTNNMQPRLELNYNSQNGNGIYGMGWELEGLSRIERIGQNAADDDQFTSVNLDYEDRFILNGERLILTNGNVYGEAGSEYQTQIASWKKIRANGTAGSGPESFDVWLKNGTHLEFGKTPESRVPVEGNNTPFAWAINKATDLYGNTIEYFYVYSAAFGFRPSHIEYTSNSVTGAPALRRVEFDFTNQTDVYNRYMAGSVLHAKSIITEIRTYLDNQLVKRYAFTISRKTAPGATERARLESITEYDANSDNLRATLFGSSNSTRTNESATDWGARENDIANNQEAQWLTDLNGDAMADLLYNQNGTNDLRVMLSNGSGFNAEQLWGTRTNDAASGGKYQWPADINGDGYPDYVFLRNSNNKELGAMLSNTGHDFNAEYLAGSRHYDPINFDYDQWLIDINGDGITDYVYLYGSEREFRVLLGQSSGSFQTDNSWGFREFNAARSGAAQWFADLTGDGLPDYVYNKDGGNEYWVKVNNGSGFATDEKWLTRSENVAQGGQSQWWADINGDGLTDFVYNHDGTNHYIGALSSGKSLVEQVQMATRDFAAGNSGNNQWLADINGDGRADLLYQKDGAREVNALLAVGTNFASEFLWVSYPHDITNNGNSRWLADMNGNGMQDFIFNAQSGNNRTYFANVTIMPNQDVLTLIENGLGDQKRIVYSRLSDPAVFEWESGGQGYPETYTLNEVSREDAYQSGAIRNLRGGSNQVVSKLVTWDNRPELGTYNYTWNYTYKGSEFDQKRREWLGLRYVRTLDHQLGVTKEREHNLDFPFTGTTRAKSLYCAAGASDPSCVPDALLSRTEYDYYCLDPNNCPLPDEDVFRPFPGKRIYQILKKSELKSYYSYDVYDYSLLREFAYDTYGNMTLLSYLGYASQAGADLGPEDNVYTHRNFYNNVTDWLLGYNTHEKRSSDADGNQVLEQRDMNYDFPVDPGGACPTGHFYGGTMSLICSREWVSKTSTGSGPQWLETSYEYDVYGNKISTTEPGNETTFVNYESTYNTFPISKTFPQNEQGQALTVAYVYDAAFGKQIAKTDANGHTFITCLDGFGRVAKKQGPIPAGVFVTPDVNCLPPTEPASLAEVVTLETHEWKFSQDINQNLSTWVEVQQRTDWDGLEWHKTDRYVDGLGRSNKYVSSGTDGAQDVVVRRTYLTPKLVETVSLPYFAGESEYFTSREYDAYGRVSSLTHPFANSSGPGVSVETFTYSGSNEITHTRAVGTIDEISVIGRFTWYDGKHQMVERLLPSDGNASTLLDYDRLGRLVKITDPIGVINEYTFNSLHKALTFFESNVGLTAYSYNTRGLLEESVDAINNKTAYSYDLRKRITARREYLPGNILEREDLFTYDQVQAGFDNTLGHLSTVETFVNGLPESQFLYGYDPYGRSNTNEKTFAALPGIYTSASEYDPLGRETAHTYPDGSFSSNSYNPMGYMDSQILTDFGSGDAVSAAYSGYNALGRVGSVLYGNNASALYTYYLTGLLDEVQILDGAAGQLMHKKYNWNYLFKVWSTKDEMFANGLSVINYSQSFAYANERLIHAQAPGTYGIQAYSYDKGGNLTQHNSTNYTYNGQQVNSGEIGGVPVFSAQFDAVGNMTSKDDGTTQWTYTFDAGNRLTSVSDYLNPTPIDEFQYDSRGIRTVKSSNNGTLTVYVSPRYVIETDGIERTSKYLLGPGGRVAEIGTVQNTPGTTRKYFHENHINSINIVTDDLGQESARVVYQPFGLIDAQHSVGQNTFRYKFGEKELDAGSDLYYFNARYYDANITRFISADDRAGGKLTQTDALNRYAYALNNPVNYSDPSGHSFGSWFKKHILKPAEHFFNSKAFKIISAVVGTIVAVSVAVLTDGAASGLSAELEGAVLGDVAAEGAGEAATGAAEGVGSEAVESAGEGAAESTADESAGASSESNADESEQEVQDDENSGGCFVAGTFIAVEEGFKKIEDIQVGDRVWSFNPITKDIELKIVVETYLRISQSAYTIVAGSEVIVTTSEHPFSVAGVWVPAMQLNVGDYLTKFDGRSLRITSISSEEGKYPVYNFTVQDNHNYFVTESRVLVHNQDCRGFRDQEARDDHFLRHGARFANAQEYEQGAVDMMNIARNAPNMEGLYTWTRANGDFAYIYMESAEGPGVFSVMDNQGFLRTAFGNLGPEDFARMYMD